MRANSFSVAVMLLVVVVAVVVVMVVPAFFSPVRGALVDVVT
jgi:hypothetical protein